MTSFYYAIISTNGNWFQTNQSEHESNDCAANTVTCVCVINEKDMELKRANLINICHCNVVKQNRNYKLDLDIGSCEGVRDIIHKCYRQV